MSAYHRSPEMGVAGKLDKFLTANPGEELTLQDICTKFGRKLVTAQGAMSAINECGDARNKKAEAGSLYIGLAAGCQSEPVQRPKEPPRETVGPAALAMAAQAWCVAGTSRMEMQPELAFEFARILERETRVPRLGCATTRELLDELRARSDLNYRTWQP